MSIATLVIGLGGTGVLTVRALKKLYDGLPEDERVPASLLAFDFDRSALLAKDQFYRFEDLSEDEFFYLNPKALQELVRNLDRGEDGGLAWEKILKWFPDRARIPIPSSEVEANGASQLRVLGRLGFFLNDEVIERSIRLKLNDLGTEIDPTRLAEDKRVVIVSSVAGGTGAGMLIDMAYVVRRQLLRPRVFTYLMLPEVFQDVDSGGRIFQNSYASIKELAFLKDQQIPFDAEYERIPPIRIPVAGEEPFSRIFLCRGEGFAGAEAIKAATIQIAQSILGQLQRTIQEKTLAIASNTLSADPADEQRKRRTHCFSTVTSTIIELEKIDVREAIFQKIVEVLKDEKALEEIYQERVEAVFEQIGQEFEPVPESEASTAEKTDGTSEPEPTDVLPEVKRLAKEWEERITWLAQQTRDDLLKQFLGTITSTEDAARKGEEKTDLDDLRRKLDDVKKLTPGAIGAMDKEQATKASLSNLKEAQASLEDFDKQVLSLLTPLNPEIDPSTGQAIMRRTHYSQLLRWKERFLTVKLPSLTDSTRAKENAWREREEGLQKKGWRFLGGARTEYTDTVERLRLDCLDLREIFAPREDTKTADEATRAALLAFLLLRAREKLLASLEGYRKEIDKKLETGQKPWIERKHQPLEIQRTFAHLGHLRPKVLEWLRRKLPELLDETRQEFSADDPPETKRRKLLDIITRHLRKVPELRGPHYVFTKQPDEVEDFIRERLVRSRQQIFERRTPNPQRKGIALIMVPEGLIWPGGDRQVLRRFLEASASQILASRVQIEDYEGSRIWLYYEDLFNPPQHIRNVDEYYRTYSSQEFRELFHIDRRFLENPVFKEVHSQHATVVITCGNPPCRANITGTPRTEKICPGCGKMIRTRCGNPDCTENALDQHPQGKEKTCPSCKGFNHAAWWCCTKHGKVPYEVPIDKERCPLCIEQHQQDPITWPLSKVSVRPDVLETLPCPHCEVLAESNSKHEVFRIRRDLKPFYLNGVNGHDRESFFKVANDYHLPQNVRCPSCRTILIPIHHQKMPRDCGGRPVQ